MKSWKTTLAGAAIIALAAFAAWTGKVDATVAGAMIVAGMGLVAARDNDKTSEDVGAGK